MKKTNDTNADEKAVDTKKTSSGASGEKNRNVRNDIYIIVVLALIVVVIAGLAIYKLRTDEKELQEEEQQIRQSMNQQMNDVASSAERIMSGDASTDEDDFRALSAEEASIYEGTYLVQNESNGITAIQFMPECEAVVSLVDSNETGSGTWLCREKDGIVLIFLGLYTDADPVVHQFMVWNNYLIDVKSIYSGEIPDGERFNTTIVQSDSNGKMTVKLTDDGSAEAEYLNTDPESEENGLTVVYKGSYEVNGDIVSVELAGDTSNFLKFNYKSDDFAGGSGLAAVYFKKDN